MDLKLLTLSNLYPNEVQPRHGIFTEHRMSNMLKSQRVQIKVVAPVPYFPFSGSVFGKYSVGAKIPRSARREGIDIIYPRYPMIPKVGMNVQPLLLAAAMVGPLKKLIRNGYDFDVIDAYYFYPEGVAAALLGRFFGKPVIITAYGNDISLIPRYALPKRMIQWAAHEANGITTVCQALKDALLDLGAAEDKVRVVLHGVDLKLFRLPDSREEARKKLGLSRRTLLTAGHLIERKGHHIAIQALVNLPDTDLLIAGDGEEEKNLRQLAESLGVADRVRFLGHVAQRDLPGIYGATDALLLPSSREGIANVLVESLACGNPVVATNVWGAPEVITVPEAGVLMESRTPQSLVEAVEQLFSVYPDRVKTRRFAEQFTWERTTEQHLALLDEIVSRS